MQNWTIAKVWRRSRPLAVLMTALVALATAMLAVSIAVGQPLPYLVPALWMTAGMVIGVGLAVEVYERV